MSSPIPSRWSWWGSGERGCRRWATPASGREAARPSCCAWPSLPASGGGGWPAPLVLGGLERLRTDAIGGIETCFLEVRTNNAAAIAFYHEMAFEPVGQRRAYYRDGSDALVYARRVTPL